MSDIKISLDSSGPKGEISVVRVDGVIDTMTATDLEKVMNSLLERKRYNIIIDLGGVDYISSAGWGIFISNIREIRQHSGDIKLARMIPNVYEIFELLEFDSILKAFDSVEKAKSDFNGVKKPAPGTEAITPTLSAPIPHSNPGSGLSEAPRIDLPPEDEMPPAAEKPVSDVDSQKEVAGPGKVILDMISKDPFLTISEIKTEIRRKHPSMRVSWWGVWRVLRREKLLSKKNRFRRARLKSGGN